MDSVSLHPLAQLFSKKSSWMERNTSAREADGSYSDPACCSDVFERSQRLHGKKSIKLTVSYLGTRYFGWQKTKSGPSIQEELETACARILQETCPCEAASRTDRGVHAKGQMVQFYTTKEITLEKLHTGLNGVLPRDIRVLAVESLEFHPTLDAIAKTYHYDLCLSGVQDPFYRHLSWHYPHRIDLPLMKLAAKELIGTRDFSAFTTENKKNPLCTLSKIELIPLENNRLRIALTGDRFLYKMARTIAGTLANLGSGKLTALCLTKDRTQTGVTAPPHGLTLFKVYY
jgi:tRNA pseudouridine38-40 synthase